MISDNSLLPPTYQPAAIVLYFANVNVEGRCQARAYVPALPINHPSYSCSGATLPGGAVLRLLLEALHAACAGNIQHFRLHVEMQDKSYEKSCNQ
jgi:hypothetical protein